MTSLFGGGQVLNASQSGTIVPQSFVGIAGQTLFTLSAFTYTPNTSSIDVYINGTHQGSGRDYTETSSTSFTLSQGVVAGDLIDVFGVVAFSANAVLPGGIILGGSYSLSQYFTDQVINVKQYPYLATGSGIVDDTAAVQAAIATGKTVFFPIGSYLLSATVLLATTNQTVYGAGQLSIILTNTDIEAMASNTAVFGVVIRDLAFNNTVNEGSGGPTHFQLHHGVNASGCTVLRCGFNTALTGAVVSTTHHAGVWFQGGNLNNILDCTFGQAQILMESTDSTIRGGFVYAFTFEYAIKITSTGEIVVNGIRGILGGPSKGCIWIPNPSYMNKIVDNYFGGSYSNINIGNGITADQPQMMQILGNTFHEVDGIGINLTNPASGNVIKGNTFWAGDPKQNDATNLIPGNQDILIQSTLFGASGTVITGNAFNRFVGPVEGTMPGIGKSNAIEFNGFAGTANNVVHTNSISGARYFSPAIVDPNANDIVRNNVGSPFSGTWIPSDISGAGLVFTAVNCKYIRTVESVTVWGLLTFPATADGRGVTIGGLPFSPASGMEGAGGIVKSTLAGVQKVVLTPAQTYFFFTDSSQNQQTNVTCSAHTFAFSATYLI